MTFPLLNGEAWVAEALCAQVDAGIFYPDKGDKEAAYDAQQVCKQCVVQPECLEYALERNEPFGVWGGMTVMERKLERRNRRRDGWA